MKSARIYGREAYASGKVTALSFKRGEKKNFNKWLALSPVRYSSCVWLTG